MLNYDLLMFIIIFIIIIIIIVVVVVIIITGGLHTGKDRGTTLRLGSTLVTRYWGEQDTFSRPFSPPPPPCSAVPGRSSFTTHIYLSKSPVEK